MKAEKTSRGFIVIDHEQYPPVHLIDDKPGQSTILSWPKARLLQESSAIGEYDDSLDCPGSSYLWVGDNHHLNRDEITTLIQILQYWLLNKRLPMEMPNETQTTDNP